MKNVSAEILRNHLRAGLDPRSIAIIGASENSNKVGGRPIKFLQEFGFKGKIYPINPARQEIQGIKSWNAIEDIDDPIDVAIVALAGEQAFQAIDRCAARGVKLAVVMTGGLTEADPIHGKQLERDMVARAHQYGMRIVGPNSQGLANFGTGAIASFSTMFVEIQPMDGPVAVVSQSGAMSVVPYGILRRRGIGIRHAHATGNDADVTVCELASLVAEDTDIKLLLLYLEGLPDPHQLARAAKEAHARNLPIIAVKGGRTSIGQAAAASHTGALATEDRVVDAFFEKHGILRARDMKEMLSGAELYLKGWKPQGKRIVIMSTSGASCVMASDTASENNLLLSEFTQDTQPLLRAALPSIANAINPIDITGAILSDSSIFGRTLQALQHDEGIDALLTSIPVSGAGYDVQLFAQEAFNWSITTGKPFIFASPQPEANQHFNDLGIPTFAFDTEAIQAFSRFVMHHELMRVHAKGKMDDSFQAMPAPLLVQDLRMLDEYESMKVIASAGVDVVKAYLCRSEEEAKSAFRDIRQSVVMKGCSEKIAHKSELGIVQLNIRDENHLSKAWKKIKDVFDVHQIEFQGVLMAPMVKGRRELMIGAHHDALFGPVVVIGDGGKYIEAMPDTQLMLPPFTENDVLIALGRLRIAPLLEGVRGEPPMDVSAFIKNVMTVQKLIQQGNIASLDINPILIDDRGQGVCAVDAVVFKPN